MHRWLLILVLVIIPAQLVWAAAAPYCGHETEAAAKQHVGHHEHRHAAGDPAPAGDDGGPAGVTTHADCQACHPGAAASFPVLPRLPAQAPPLSPQVAAEPRYLSPVPSGPERPDWALPAAAVRFGGGVAPGPFPLS